MSWKPSLASKNSSQYRRGLKYRLVMACCIALMVIGIALWWNRLSMMQLALQQFLEGTPLLSPKFSGFQFGFDQAVLSEMEFGIGTDAGVLSVKLENIKVGYHFGVYGFNAPKIEAINIGHARLKFAYPVAYQPRVKDEALSGTMAYPLGLLTVGILDFESNTPWGLARFAGSMEINSGKADVVEAKLQDAKYTIQIEFGPGFHTAKVIAEDMKGGKIFDLDAWHLGQPNKSARLRAGVGASVNWLSTSTLMPETWRAAVAASIVPRMASGMSAMQLDLTAGTPDNFGTVKGKALLTRDSRYLARTDWAMPKPGTFDVDGHLDLAAMEVIEFLKPWLPEMASVGRLTDGNVQGTLNLRWQSRRIISGTAHLKVSDVALTAGQLRLGHGTIEAEINDFTNPTVTVSADVPALDLGKGMVARNFIFKAHFLGHDLTLERAGLSLFGGLLEVLPSTVKTDQRPVLLTLRASNIDLPQLLSSLHYKDLTATGTINGEFPLRLALDSIELQDGLLNGIRPGVLRYQGPVADKENIAFRALRNLEYHSLQAKVNYRPDGDYHLGLRIEGSNPQVLSGHPLAFNLNLSGHLPELLQRGFMAGDFGRVILEEAKPKPANPKKPVKPLLKPLVGEPQPKPQPAGRRSQ
ncbi:MAG: YdbH domain-containing protein [Methylovulum sp.]|nr:YdbH domain-containing protein [Methylovulum sp.]